MGCLRAEARWRINWEYAARLFLRGYEKKAAKNIKKAAKKFASALGKKRSNFPGIGEWAWFHAFKSFSEIPSYQAACPADYEYYKEKNEYFYPLKGRRLQRFLGRLFGGIIRPVIKKSAKPNLKPDSGEKKI